MEKLEDIDIEPRRSASDSGRSSDSSPPSPRLGWSRRTASRYKLRGWLRFSLLLNAAALLYFTNLALHKSNLVVISRDLGLSEVTFDPANPLGLGEEQQPASRPAVETGTDESYFPGIEGGRCSLCAVNPALCEELGPKNAIRALGYRGENARLRRMLAKLRAGQPINYAVVGGSVSKGFGIFSAEPQIHPSNMHRIIFDHLDAKFPGKGEISIDVSRKAEGRNGFTNGALGATGTDYFQYCFSEHMFDDVDLVVIEQAINDQRKLEASDSYEQLVRALLDLPGEPAIMNIHTFGFVFPEVGTGGDQHLSVAEYYDIPTINLRNLWLGDILNDYSVANKVFHVTRKEGELDTRHISVWGHQIAGNLTSAYIDMQLCEMDRIEAAMGHSNIDELYPLPRMPRQKLLEPFDQTKVLPKFKPNCFSMNAKKNKLVPSKNEGFREWFHESVPSKKYLIADKPGSSVSVKFATVIGKVEVHYFISGTYGLGSVDCWVDDDKANSRRLDGHMDHLRPGVNIGTARVIRDDLKPGDHELTCVLSEETKDPGGKHEFRLISVMSV